MKKIIRFLMTFFLVVAPVQLTSAAPMEDYYLTCYTPIECPGEITYTGANVREGIAATTEEHIGDCALIFTSDGEFLGYWEVLDKLGTGKKNVIDVWMPTMEKAVDMMALTEGKVKVIFIEKPEG